MDQPDPHRHPVEPPGEQAWTPQQADDPRRARALDDVLCARCCPWTTACAWCSATRPSAPGCAMASGMEHVLEHDGEVSHAHPVGARPRPGHAVGGARAGPAAAPVQASRLPLVVPAERGLAPRPGGREPRERPGRGLRGPGRGAARGARPLLAARRRGGGRRRRAPAGAALRAVPHLPGQRSATRAASIPAKGLTGSGYDGHAFWDTESFVLPVLTFTAPRHRPPRARVAPLHRSTRRASAPASSGLRGRGPAVAHDPRRGVLGLLARGHGRLPRERRGGGRGTPLRRASRGDLEFERSAPAASCWWRRARLWASLGYHDERGDFRIDGVTGPRRVLRARGQQRLHEPDGPAEPALRGRRDRAPSGGGGRAWASTTGSATSGSARPTRCSCPSTRSAGFTRRTRTSSSTSRGTSRTPRPTSTRCCSTTRTSSSTASRW